LDPGGSADLDPNPHQRYDIHLVEYDAWDPETRGSVDLDPKPHQRYDDIHWVEYDDGIRNQGGLWIRIRTQKIKRIPEKGKNMQGMENIRTFNILIREIDQPQTDKTDDQIYITDVNRHSSYRVLHSNKVQPNNPRKKKLCQM
jgi:hypothetical protein